MPAFLLALVPVTAHAERFSDSCMRDFLLLKKSAFAEYIKEGILELSCLQLGTYKYMVSASSTKDKGIY